MKIDTLNDLKKVLQVCRKYDVFSIKIDNLEIKLTAKQEAAGTSASAADLFPEEAVSIPKYSPGNITDNTKIDTPDELTEEQLLYYSARPEVPQEQ